MGNDQVLCTSGLVSLSSVNCRIEEQGYRAAEILQQIAEKRYSADKCELIEPEGVVVRQSTDTFALADRNAAEALRFLREKFAFPIGQPDIQNRFGQRLPQVSTAFRRTIGRSMLSELGRLRVERGKALLGDEKLRMDEIAQLSGFSSR